jgi:hypothetical protein
MLWKPYSEEFVYRARENQSIKGKEPSSLDKTLRASSVHDNERPMNLSPSMITQYECRKKEKHGVGAIWRYQIKRAASAWGPFQVLLPSISQHPMEPSLL